MCTVTVVPLRDGLRVVCNRDERHTRPEALGPQIHTAGRRTAVFPLDPLGGGTWIAANDARLGLALLNRSDDSARPPVPRRSRGAIIPRLLDCAAVGDVADRALALALTDYAPFRLVAVQGHELAVVAWDGSVASSRLASIERPVMFTSSSFGDRLVHGARSALFDRLVSRRPRDGWLDGQRRFHRHRWRARPAMSVLMSREDARTVSRTVLDLTRFGVSLRYRPLSQVQ